MTGSVENVVPRVRFEASLAHLANALDFADRQAADNANVSASELVDRLLEDLQERCQA